MEPVFSWVTTLRIANFLEESSLPPSRGKVYVSWEMYVPYHPCIWRVYQH